jgi:hypothetical protein
VDRPPQRDDEASDQRGLHRQNDNYRQDEERRLLHHHARLYQQPRGDKEQRRKDVPRGQQLAEDVRGEI